MEVLQHLRPDVINANTFANKIDKKNLGRNKKAPPIGGAGSRSNRGLPYGGPPPHSLQPGPSSAGRDPQWGQKALNTSSP